MEAVGYLQWSQELATCPYPEPYEPNLHIPSTFTFVQKHTTVFLPRILNDFNITYVWFQF
jgi:hypothetical protein